LLVIIAAGLAGCGSAASEPTHKEVTGVGPMRAGSVASLVQCSDWSGADEDGKLATIADVRGQLNQAGADGPTPDLTDDEAMRLFDRACSQEFAAGFRLYKIYARAASFKPLTP
jgi:hypothetical protein